MSAHRRKTGSEWRTVKVTRLTLSDHAAYAWRATSPPAPLHRLIVLAGARARVARLGIPIALEKGAEAVVAPLVAARNWHIDRTPARHEADRPRAFPGNLLDGPGEARIQAP